MSEKTPFPEFEKPPVIELVCGILFKQLSDLNGAHLGGFWDRIKADYDHCKEVAPLAPVIERFGEETQVQLQFTDVPPLARTWLLTPQENGIIQLQRDRFLHNWKKVAPGDEYPRYHTVIEMFKNHLKTFEEFLSETKLGKIEPLQYEMTYINHVPQGEGWHSLHELGTLFPDFVRRTDSARFLSTPESVNWRTTFELPEKQGRLHAVVRNTVRGGDKLPIILFDLTCRGFPQDPGREAMWSWFDLAHEWIVKGFEDSTSERVRKDIWRQTQ